MKRLGLRPILTLWARAKARVNLWLFKPRCPTVEYDVVLRHALGLADLKKGRR